MGHLHIVIGPMFSGKSTYLINTINNLKMYKKNILIINSTKDIRVYNNAIKTHNDLKYSAEKYDELTTDLINIILSNNYDTVCIDEAQFFNNLYNFVSTLLNYNIHIIVAGLNGDTEQKKFGYILDLIPLANNITKLSGICTLCNDGTPGDFTYIKPSIVKTDQILVGDHNMYLCVCRKHLNNNK